MNDQQRKEQERILNSEDFTALYNNIRFNNSPLSDLPPEQLRVAIYLYSTGQESLIDGLNNILYKRRVPSIREFLDDPKYLSRDVGGSNVFPKWRDVLFEVFAPESRVFEVIFGGAIGGGKTTIACLAEIYNLVRVTSLRYPQKTLGSTPISLLVLQLISITLDKAGLALMKRMQSILQSCYLFQEVKSESEFLDYTDSEITPYVNGTNQIVFPNNIIVQMGSRITHALSFDLIGAILDEAEFRISGPDEAIQLYTNLRERVTSRFLDSYRFTLLCLISSARYTTGVIADHVNNLRSDDPNTKYYAFPIWEIRSFDAYQHGHFYVMRGTKSHPSRILTEDEVEKYEAGQYAIPQHCSILKVPNAYRKQFEKRIDEALRNLAGVQTFGHEFLFDDLSKIEYPDLTPEITIESEIGRRQDLTNQLPKSLFTETAGVVRLARYPKALRYVHIDLAETSEAGISIVHKELGRSGETIYVADMILRIITRTRIDFDSIYNLIKKLREMYNVIFYKISADQFQSSHIMQKLKSDGLATEVDRVSVDRTPEPYYQLSQVVMDGCLHVGKSPILLKQLANITDEAGKIVSTARKDVADGLCGAVHNALMNTKDVPIYSRYGLYEDTSTLVASVLGGKTRRL